MNNYRNKEEEKKRKRKGIFYSFGLHSLLLLLFFLPFLDQTKDPEFENVVIVEFEKSGSSLEGAQSAGPSGSPSPKVEETVEEPVEESKPVPTEITTPRVETRPEVITSKNSDIKIPKQTEKPKRPEPKKPTPETKKPTPTKVESKPTTKPKPTRVPSTKKPSPQPKAGSGGVGTGSGNNSGKSSDSGSGKGTGGKGTGNKGKGSSNKGAGEDGRGDGLFGDIGKLKRERISGPDIVKAIGKSGTIKMRLCIDRAGNVKKIAYEPKGSTIRDKYTINKAIDVFKESKFNANQNTTYLECGIFTVVINIDSNVFKFN